MRTCNECDTPVEHAMAREGEFRDGGQFFFECPDCGNRQSGTKFPDVDAFISEPWRPFGFTDEHFGTDFDAEEFLSWLDKQRVVTPRTVTDEWPEFPHDKLTRVQLVNDKETATLVLDMDELRDVVRELQEANGE